MTNKEKPKTVNDTDLDQAQGGGVFGTPAGGWGRRWSDHDNSDPGMASRYIGETEKNVRMTPAGTEASVVFEPNDEP